jgi:hypothetical protein
LSYAQALLGDRDGAMASLDKLLAELPHYPLRMQFFIHANAGIVDAWIGEKDRAVDQILPLMGLPVQATSSVYGLHEDIDFWPLRGFPRWEALIAAPAYRQPFTY